MKKSPQLLVATRRDPKSVSRVAEQMKSLNAVGFAHTATIGGNDDLDLGGCVVFVMRRDEHVQAAKGDAK